MTSKCPNRVQDDLTCKQTRRDNRSRIKRRCSRLDKRSESPHNHRPSFRVKRMYNQTSSKTGRLGSTLISIQAQIGHLPSEPNDIGRRDIFERVKEQRHRCDDLHQPKPDGPNYELLSQSDTRHERKRSLKAIARTCSHQRHIRRPGRAHLRGGENEESSYCD